MKILIGIGSNIDAEANLRAAASRLKALWPSVRFSSVWRSKAREIEDQPDFLNAVAMIESDDLLNKIFVQLLAIEKELKKSIEFRYGPRTIDLDVLLVENTKYEDRNTKMIVPHPKMHERRFVLEPLIELVGEDFAHPALKRPLKEFLDEVKRQECERTKIQLHE